MQCHQKTSTHDNFQITHQRKEFWKPFNHTCALFDLEKNRFFTFGVLRVNPTLIGLFQERVP